MVHPELEPLGGACADGIDALCDVVNFLTFQICFPHDERPYTDVHKVLWSMPETECSQTHQKWIFTSFHSHGVQDMESNRYKS